MKTGKYIQKTVISLYVILIAFIGPTASGFFVHFGNSSTFAAESETLTSESAAPVPLLQNGHTVDWWFVFKFNASKFQGCGNNASVDCIFGGTVHDYKGHSSQQFVYASSENPLLQKGTGCLGDTLKDPVGATFDEVYEGKYF